MKYYVKTFIACFVLVLLISFGAEGTQAQSNDSGTTILVQHNDQVSVTGKNGKDLDFSKLRTGEFAFVEMYDSKGAPYTFKVERKAGLKFAVSVNTNTLGDVEANTVVQFVGKGKTLKSVNLDSMKDQRCGLWCIMINICCVHIHIGPPGNTWEWSCSNCNQADQ